MHLRISEHLRKVGLETRQRVETLRPRTVKDEPNGAQILVMAKD